MSAGGRPTKYKAIYAKQAVKLCDLGATDQELAAFFEVDISTLYRWKNTHKGFCDAIKTAKSVADERVERSLYQRALGYVQDDVKIFMHSASGEPVYAPFKSKVVADTTAAIFWLKNRRPDEWRDKKEHDIGVDGSLAALIAESLDG